MSYIGKVQVGSGEPILIGSTLYGVCPSSVAASTAAKTVTLSNFDTLINGVTVHVRFVNGNTVTSGLTLAVGSTGAKTIVGNCVCNENDIVAFTFHQETVNNIETEAWYVNSNIVAAEGSANGQIKINGQNIDVHGLGSAAYTASSAYASSDHNHTGVYAPSDHNHTGVYAPVNNPTFTGTVTLPGNSGDNNEAASKQYVIDATSNIAGLSGAMHFKGEVNTEPTNNATAFTTYNSGDVILYQDKEYVYVKKESATTSEWILLGAEGSYALNSNTASIGSASGWSAGSASDATVSNGVLVLTNSTTPSLTVSSTNVVVPVTPSTP